MRAHDWRWEPPAECDLRCLHCNKVVTRDERIEFVESIKDMFEWEEWRHWTSFDLATALHPVCRKPPRRPPLKMGDVDRAIRDAYVPVMRKQLWAEENVLMQSAEKWAAKRLQKEPYEHWVS